MFKFPSMSLEHVITGRYYLGKYEMLPYLSLLQDDSRIPFKRCMVSWTGTSSLCSRGRTAASLGRRPWEVSCDCSNGTCTQWCLGFSPLLFSPLCVCYPFKHISRWQPSWHMIYHPEMYTKKFAQVRSSPTYRYYSWNWETLLRNVRLTM